MPFPLPNHTQTLRVPHLSTIWFDLNYHNHVIMIYRPSPLCPSITIEKVTILADAAAMSIRHVATMHRQQRFAFNWSNLFTVFSSILALIYTITTQPEPISAYLQRSDGLADLRLAADILKMFGERTPSALKYREMVLDVISRLESHLTPMPLGQPPAPTLLHETPAPIHYQQPPLPWTPPSGGTGTAAEMQYPLLDALNDRGNTQIFPEPLRMGDTHPEMNMLSTTENLPSAVHLFETAGLFNDWVGIDHMAGFDMSHIADMADMLEPPDNILNQF